MSAERDSAPVRTEQRAAQAAAFDIIGDGYDVAFPHKDGQFAAGASLAERLGTGSRVLDVGCGTGLPTARQLTDAGCAVTGIDISPVMLGLARQNVPEATFLEADVTEVTPALGEFDAAVAFFSLLMLTRAEIPAALESLREVLVPGGWLVLGMVEADVDNVEVPFVGTPIRVSGYLRDELRAVIEKAGFTVVEERNLHYAPATTQVPPEMQLFLHCRVNPTQRAEWSGGRNGA
jgi:SAM-dependent methyltransferase